PKNDSQFFSEYRYTYYFRDWYFEWACRLIRSLNCTTWWICGCWNGNWNDYYWTCFGYYWGSDFRNENDFSCDISCFIRGYYLSNRCNFSIKGRLLRNRRYEVNYSITRYFSVNCTEDVAS